MRRILSLASSTIVLLTSASPAFAQNVTGFDESGIPFTEMGKLMSNALSLLFFFAGLLTFFFIVVGGIQWITVGGDAKAAQAARDRITAAVVGLIVVVAAFAIALIVEQVLGIKIVSGFCIPTPSGPCP